MKFIILFIILSSLIACTREDNYNVGKVETYVPIYSDRATAEVIQYLPPQPFEKGGKIATYQGKLYQVEEDKGIHILTPNTGSGAAIKIGFISIPMCKEVTLKDGFIYTNNISDLITINLSTLLASAPSANNVVTVANRQRNVFAALVINQVPTAPSGSYFECADANKLVIRWEVKTIDNPKCKLR